MIVSVDAHFLLVFMKLLNCYIITFFFDIAELLIHGKSIFSVDRIDLLHGVS